MIFKNVLTFFLLAYTSALDLELTNLYLACTRFEIQRILYQLKPQSWDNVCNLDEILTLILTEKQKTKCKAYETC